MIRRWWPVLRDALTNVAGLVRDWRQHGASTTTEESES
jgi:hypothetical protein